MSTPDYYLLPDGTECRKFIEGMSYYLGTAFAYLWRAGHKTGEPMVKDLRKALDNIRFELEREEFVKLPEIKNYVYVVSCIATAKFPQNIAHEKLISGCMIGIIWANSEVTLIDKNEYLSQAAAELTELINSLEAQNE